MFLGLLVLEAKLCVLLLCSSIFNFKIVGNAFKCYQASCLSKFGHGRHRSFWEAHCGSQLQSLVSILHRCQSHQPFFVHSLRCILLFLLKRLFYLRHKLIDWILGLCLPEWNFKTEIVSLFVHLLCIERNFWIGLCTLLHYPLIYLCLERRFFGLLALCLLLDSYRTFEVGLRLYVSFVFV